MNQNPKANFDDSYSLYLPKKYVTSLIRDLDYSLPFQAMQKLRSYYASLLPQKLIRVTSIGSSHGLDAVALKYGSSAQEILARWTDDTIMTVPFPASDSGVEATLIDMHPEPLRFAKDVNLSDKSFVVDLQHPYPAELKQHFAEMTDIVVAIGMTSYLGVKGLEKIIRAAYVNGSAKLLCFSALKYLDIGAFVDVCLKHGLEIRHLGEVPQRNYKDEGEQKRVNRILQDNGIASQKDEVELMSFLFLAHKKEIVTDLYDKPSKSAQTLIVVNQEETLVGSTSDHYSDSAMDWPHPWLIALSEEHSQSRAIHQKLTELHIAGQLQPGDIVTTIKNTSVNNVGHIAHLFAGEYEVSETNLPNGQIRQTLTRISPVINANIINEVPACPEALEAELRDFGHVLIRSGKPINEGYIAQLLAGNGKAMDYRYGNTDRKKINGSSTLEVTPWPKELSILPHSELTYHTEFPKIMSFICKTPADYGGETSLYDCAKAFESLSPAFQQKAARHNVIFHKKYVQQLNHSRYSSWQQILGEGTSHKALIEHFSALGYRCILSQEKEEGTMIDVVETQLTRPIVYQHQGKQCLHSSIVGIAPYWYEQVWLGKQPPLSATWDNEEAFSVEELRHMEEALLSARIIYNNLQKHDVIIVDNIRVAHGRLPFIGERVVGALMAQPARFTHRNNQWAVEVMN